MTVSSDYYNILAQIESGGNPLAKAATSTASGLYQFTHSTWANLGFSLSDIFNTDAQNQAIQKLTGQNAHALSAAGIPVTNENLYAAHFLGAPSAINVLQSDPSEPLTSVLSNSVISANPFLANMTVGDFKQWLSSKVSVGQSSGGSILDDAIAGLGSIFGNNPLGQMFGGAGTAGQMTANVANKTITGGIGELIAGFFNWITDLFSASTGARFAAVLIGIAMVIVAIIFLTGSDKVIIETAKDAAKTAAIAA